VHGLARSQSSIFRSRRQRIRADHADSLVGPNTEIRGDVRFTGNLVIFGTAFGNVMSDLVGGRVICLLETGRVEGEIRIPNVVVNGTVSGEVLHAHTCSTPATRTLLACCTDISWK
jgi:cytoskeletal protein CcmA (bactofilin family)